MREDILRVVRAEYEQLRNANEELALQRRKEVMDRVPRMGRLLGKRESLIMDGLKGILNGTGTGMDLTAGMESLNCEIAALLTENGYSAHYLDPVYRCPLCRDTGTVGETVKEYCSCMKQRYQELLTETAGLTADAAECFEKYDEHVFSTEIIKERGYSQRQLANRVRQACEEWANTWPDNLWHNILLMGQAGLGKTFFMNAMARRLRERGKQVMTVSAYRFLEIARKAWFGDTPDALDEFLNIEVLFVDDVGTEPLMQNVTVEQFFNLINERKIKGLATVMSTNLNKSQFRERYTERVASRMMDTRDSLVLTLLGDDIRRRG